MPSWNEVLKEIQSSKRVDALDDVRRKYIRKLNRLSGRNVIAYYSGWLQRPGIITTSVNDDDKNGLMATVHKLDRTKGLDILLHTPGGDLAATESIVDYLRSMFGNNVRAIIPQLAMSAGTMIACSCDEIIMGKQSNIGPVDPQFGGIPAHGVISEFNTAIEKIKEDPSTTPIWQTVVSKYHPTFIGECANAITMASEMLQGWLETGMFRDDPEKTVNAKKVVDYLNNHDDTKTHSRHIHIEEAKSTGLNIKSLEEDFDQDFQDTVLTIHHAFMHTFANSGAIKIIENHLRNAIVLLNPQPN